MKRILMTTALVALTSGAAFAESHAAASGDGMTAEAQYEAQDGTKINVSDLLGKTVYIKRADSTDTVDLTDLTDVPDSWQDVADVSDILIDKDGNLSSIVLDAGGFLGMGETPKTVSFDSLEIVPDQDDENEYFVVYTGDKRMLEESDDYDSAMMSDEVYTSASTQMQTAGDDTTMTEQDTASTDTEASTDTDATASAETDEQTDTAAADTDGMQTEKTGISMTEADLANLTAEELEGTAVYGLNDERVGEIGQLVLAEGGTIDKLIVDVGGFLGLGERHVALNFEDIDLRQTENGTLSGYVSMDEDQLKSMEEWEKAD